MSESYKKLIKTLQSLFEMDKADLDFGIYRIMNQKRDEMNRFLEHDLLPQVQQAFADYAKGGQQDLQKELMQAREQAHSYGVADVENAPPVLAVKEKIQDSVDMQTVENEIYSHLNTFFSRYYDKGDFISLRRYKKDTYAIPYEGEEVKLYWANHDQYYIKSSEHLRDYAFVLPLSAGEGEDKTIRVKLIEADIEKDNNKATGDQERCFMLDENRPLEVIGKELHIHFNYVTKPKNAKQAKLNEEAVKTIFAQTGFGDWLAALKTPAPTESNPSRTMLEKHLNDYTARNTYDYFIHKDLSGFLRRELDFYIKNEVLFLDDIDDAAFSVTEQHLRKIKVLRALAHKIIRMLAQIEDYQKKLWLKKKFVVATGYCVTLDKVPADLYPDIMQSEAQWQEWVKLGFIDNSTPESDRLTQQPYLVLDTQFFADDFKDKLIAGFDDLDAQLDGLLIHSENFQALILLQECYKEKVKCVYIDPPYNTGSNDFTYKDNFRNSSWMAMLQDRIDAIRSFMSLDGVLFASIDDKDDDNRVSHRFMQLLENSFGQKNYLDNLIWVKNTTHNDAKIFSHNHEYILAFSKNRNEAAAEHAMFRQNKPGYIQVMELVHKLQHHYPSIFEIQKEIRQLYQQQTERYKQQVLAEGLPWNDEIQRNDPWKGIKQYKFAEYRLDGKWVSEEKAKQQKAKIWIYRESDPSWPNANSLTTAHRSPEDDEYRFYNPKHPLTGLSCSAPARGWLWRKNPNPSKPLTLSFASLDKEHLIAYGNDENKIPQIKRFLHNVESDVVKSVITDFSDGEKELAHVVGERGTFPNPKPTSVIQKLIEITTNSGDWIMDTYVGSGTTAHALLKQNFADEKRRKFIFIEMGEYFNFTLLPRIKRLCYSLDWQDGKPQSEESISQCFKYLKLESYEDALNNLLLKRSKGQQDLLDQHAELREDYLLGYWLDVETRDSASLLNLDRFEDPFNYRLNIATGSVNASRLAKIDLVETFNYLLGLTVKRIYTECGFKIVQGVNPKDETVLVIWRNLKEKNNAALEEFMIKSGYNPRDTEYAHIYVNGDHTLDDPRSKVKMIEIEFRRLMFDVQGI